MIKKKESKESIVDTYARDLFQLAATEGILERVKDELSHVRELITSMQKLKDFLNNPNITNESKKGIISELFDNRLSPVTINHLNLIIDEERHAMLLDIIEAFFDQIRIAENRIVAYVTTFVAMPDETTKLLSGELSRLTGKEVELIISVDESILGGIIIRINDKILDCSLGGRLKKIGDYLKERI